jgi:hypothetical protein
MSLRARPALPMIVMMNTSTGMSTSTQPAVLSIFGSG